MNHLPTPYALALEAQEVLDFPGSERQIEFVGPPGVGKSAIYHAVRELLAKESVFRTAQEGRLLAARASLNRLGWLRRVSYRSAFHLPRVGMVYARRVATSVSDDTFRQIIHRHDAFLECCIEMARTGFGDAFARFGRLPIMLEHLQDLHLWDRLPAPVRILQQDALVQKGWTCPRDLRTAYFSSVPRPGAAVLVSADPDIVVDRLRTRGRKISAHVGLGDGELRAATVDAAGAFNLASRLLSSRGVAVLQVSGEASLPEVARQVVEFLNDQNSGQEGERWISRH